MHSFRNLSRTARRSLLAALVAAPALLLAAPALRAAPTVTLYKTPWCGCCAAWGEYLANAGFTVATEALEDLDLVKRMAGVPEGLAACHTAMIDGYVVEGHVPLSAVRRLLAERPEVRGIAAPGMPAGSPGMPAPQPEAFTVFAFDGDGRITPFARYLGDRELPL
ncbi:MAG TPA: DUF411 domain-containing protein [Rhodospirillales bacterium]|nr:DUF411 domain-containing protein [Rhodospirillales bacterium]